MRMTRKRLTVINKPIVPEKIQPPGLDFLSKLIASVVAGLMQSQGLPAGELFEMGHVDEKALLDAKKAPLRELRLRFGKAGVDAVLPVFQVVNEGVESRTDKMDFLHSLRRRWQGLRIIISS